MRWCLANFQCRGVLLIWMSRARAFCACSRCGWGLFGHFFSRLSFLFLSPSLWETARYRLKYCLKGPLSPKQPTNQPSLLSSPELGQSLNKDCLQRVLKNTITFIAQAIVLYSIITVSVYHISVQSPNQELWLVLLSSRT